MIGLNCSTGPEDMRDAIRFLGEFSPLPVHCIPNAGIPHQGPEARPIFPEQPGPLADVLGEFVERYGVSIVGGCCGTTPDHIRAIGSAARATPVEHPPGAAPAARERMITAAPLAQEPAPTIVGERVNSQGSRKAKEMLLADDYDGLVQVAEDQVEGGAHVLDLCVALTERQDEDEQMRLVAKNVSLTQPAPIQVDSTEPDVIETALDQIPGRAIVNSVNLEAGRDKLDKVVPIAMEHGAALIALTIDEVGMAKTRERKLEIAQRIHELVCDEHGLDPELLIFDVLTFTLTTGDDEWKPSAVETIEGIRRIKEELPGVKTSLGVSNVSFGVGLPARAVLNSVFLHHCVEAGLDLAMVNPNHITPYGEIARGGARRWPTTSSSTRARTRSSASSPTSSPRARRPRPSRPTRPRAWSPRRRCTSTSCAARRTAWRTQIDASVEKIGAVPTLNDVLLPAMKEVGDKFGAGELILPFVLQSAEVMKRAVAQLEKYLDKLEGYTKGTVVLATVFGDVHDIGKSLVNTILTNNGYTRRRPRQAGPDRHDPRRRQGARGDRDRPLRPARLHLQADAAVRAGAPQLTASSSRVLIGGAAINRDFGWRACTRAARSPRRSTSPGVFYCKDAFEGLAVMDQIVEADKRAALVEQVREGAAKLRDRARSPRSSTPTDDTVRSDAAHRQPGPRAAVLGRPGDRRRPRRGLPPPRHARAVQAPLGRPRREGRRVERAGRGGLPPAPGAHVGRAGLPAPARAARLLPLLLRGQRARRARPGGPRDASSSA